MPLGSPLPRADSHGDCIYLDYQATTPIWPEVADAAEPYLRLHWGNPSSGHAFGRSCKSAVDGARTACASLLGAEPEEIVFLSCGSEADNHAIVGPLQLEEARRRAAHSTGAELPLPHAVSSVIEHPAVVECLAALEAAGRIRVTLVGVDFEGRVSAAEVAAAVTLETVIVTIMHSNNEVGSLQPIEEIVRLIRSGSTNPDVLIHTDAAQSVGKVSLDVRTLGVDMLTLVGHKFGAPKGVAALYIRKGLTLPNFLHGGGQEGGRRAGTESVLLLAALGEAARIAKDELLILRTHMGATRDRLASLLIEGLGSDFVRINGPSDPENRLPNTLSIGLRGVQASTLLANISDQLAASAGAACHTTSHASVSAVLRAMEVPLEFAVGTLRLSSGRHTSMDEIEKAAKLIITEVVRQRNA